MEDREAFDPHNAPKDLAKNSRVVYAYGKDGAIFDLFELVLPKGTSVTRSDPETVAIHAKRFLMNIRIDFEGFGAVLPTDFEELYLGKKFTETHCYKVGLDINVNFKLRSLISRSGWEYFQWLDSLSGPINKTFSFDQFIEDIGWETAHSVAKIFERQKGVTLN